MHSNNSISLRTGRGLALDSSAWLRHPLLVRDVPVLGEMMPLWSQQRAAADGEANGHEDDDLGSLVNFMSQRYMLSGDERNPHRVLSREIWVCIFLLYLHINFTIFYIFLQYKNTN